MSASPQNQGIRLFIVTDHADHAAIDVFARDPDCLPAWARLVTRVEELKSIPDGAKVISRFYGPRGVFEDFWVEERVLRAVEGRGFDLDVCAHMDAIAKWRPLMWSQAPAEHQAEAEPAPPPVVSEPERQPTRNRRIWS